MDNLLRRWLVRKLPLDECSINAALDERRFTPTAVPTGYVTAYGVDTRETKFLWLQIYH